jgi:hypothetical protein
MTLLVVFFPAWFVRGKTVGWNGAIRKWFHTLRWALGFEAWVRKYDQIETLTAEGKINEGRACAESAEN